MTAPTPCTRTWCLLELASVPEPGSIVLGTVGLLFVVGLRLRRRPCVTARGPESIQSGPWTNCSRASRAAPRMPASSPRAARSMRIESLRDR